MISHPIRMIVMPTAMKNLNSHVTFFIKVLCVCVCVCVYHHPVVIVIIRVYFLSERTRHIEHYAFMFILQHVSAIMRQNHKSIHGKVC